MNDTEKDINMVESSENEILEEITQLDLFPEEHKFFTFLKKVCRNEFRKSGFRRISTPQVTKKELYELSWQWYLNEKYSVSEEYSLKFDPRLSVLDSYMRNEKTEELQPVYYYYIERYLEEVWDVLKERYTIWGEIIWEKDAILDMECIFLIDKFLQSIELGWKYKIKAHSVGVKKEQVKYCEALKDFYEDKKHLLSEESLENLEHNPMKLLHANTEDEEILLEQAPKMRKFLKKHSKAHLEKFEEYMELVWINYEYDETLLFENTYYNDIIWEVVEIESWKRLAWWWRYDILSSALQPELKKDIPATGFTTQISSIIALLKRTWISIRNKDELDLYFVQLGDEAKKEVFPIANEARVQWINTLSSLGTPSMKEQILKAQRSGARFVVIVGIMEARNWNWQVRNMDKWTQEEVRKEKIIDYMIEQIGKDNLNFYSPIKDLTIWEPPVEDEEEEENM